MAFLPWRRPARDTGAAPATPSAAPSPTPDDDAEAPGWDALTAVFAAAYPGQEPDHAAPVVSYRLGGPDPLDGISVYRASQPVPHWHYLTYGYSDLYGRQPGPDGESGFGIEMTLRLADPAAADLGARPPVWVMGLLQKIARYVFTSGNVIRAHHHLNANGPIAPDGPTELTALAFLADPVHPEPIATPAGTVSLVQAVGITAGELEDIIAWDTEGVLAVIGQRWPYGLTVLDRPGLDGIPALRQQVEDGAARDGSSISYYAVETLSATWDDPANGGGLAVQLSTAAARELPAAIAARLRAGKPLLVQGSQATIEFVPQPVRAEPLRLLPAPAADGSTPPARLGLTPAGVDALASLPARPGDYRLEAVPGVVWRLAG